MDIKKIFINCMAVLCVIVVVFSVMTVVKRGNEPEKTTEITYDLMENSEIIVGTEFEENTESTENVGEEVVSDEKVLYTTSKVNVRTGPATTYASLGEIQKGTEVSGVGELDEEGWQKIMYDGQEAYILGRYLTDEAPEENNDEEDESQQTSNRGQSTNGGNTSSTNNTTTNNSNVNAFGYIDPYGGRTPTQNNNANTVTQPTQPAEPTQPTEPAQPVEPTQPVDPAQPTEPAQPVEPTQPVDPAA